MINEKKKGGSGKTYSVFEITSKKTGRKHIMISSTLTLENILSTIRTYSKSKTVSGGAKELAQDIVDSGKGYEEDFTVKQVGKGMDREGAEKRKAELVTKSGKKYNQEISVA